MALSKLGTRIRMIRLQAEDSLLAMAKCLGVPYNTASTIENGYKTPPVGYISKICEHYDLSLQAQEELEALIVDDIHKLRILLDDCSNSQRVLAITIAERLPYLSDKDCAALLATIRKRSYKDVQKQKD